MSADARAVLDACVLIPMPLADTLLRMAEAPRLYLPKWSQTIMDEVTRNLIRKWDMAPEKANRREEELRRHFPEAFVAGFEPIIDSMTNDSGDRHVLAAAVHSQSDLIVTYNLPHFPAASLKPWRIDAQGPSKFLRGLYHLDAGLFAAKLHEQAAGIDVTLPRLLRSLSKNVPGFVDYFCEVQGISLSNE